MVGLGLWQNFWRWYERRYAFNVGLASGLFLLQLLHLFWMTSHVVAGRLVGQSYFPLAAVWQMFIALVDYTEIPALVGISLVYLHQLRQSLPAWQHWRALLFLLFLNAQWLHIFWITDEIILEQFTGRSVVPLPTWLAWLAISIDYLELPVMIDTVSRFLRVVGKRL